MPPYVSALLLLACPPGTTVGPGSTATSTPTFNSNDICAVGVVDEMARYPRDLFSHTYGLFIGLMAAGNACLGSGADPTIQATCSTPDESYTGSATLYVTATGTGLAFNDFRIKKLNEIVYVADGYLTVASESADDPGHMTHDNLQVQITELTAGSCDCIVGDVVVDYTTWVSSFPLDQYGQPDLSVRWSGTVSTRFSEGTLGTAEVNGLYEEEVLGCDVEPELGGLELNGAHGLATTSYDLSCDGTWTATLASGAVELVQAYPFAP